MMEGRKLIRMSTIHQKTRSIDMDSDWITMGVIVSKTDPKVSSKVRIRSIVSQALYYGVGVANFTGSDSAISDVWNV